MKKLLISIFAIILCFPCFALVGCDKSSEPVNMSTYFKNEVKYRVYPSSSNTEQTTTLNEFTHKKHDKLNQYMYVTLSGNSDWLYKMTIDKIVFNVYSNKTENVEFVVTITNLENGDTSSTGGPSVFTYKADVKLLKNINTQITIPVNDIVKSNSSTTTIKIAVSNDYFYIDKANTGLKFDINNISVFGAHK